MLKTLNQVRQHAVPPPLLNQEHLFIDDGLCALRHSSLFRFVIYRRLTWSDLDVGVCESFLPFVYEDGFLCSRVPDENLWRKQRGNANSSISSMPL